MSSRRVSNGILSVTVLACAGAINLHAGIVATATYTSAPAGASGYQYDLTLTNTGTTTIGTFWFGWIPGAGFLSSAPSSVVDPTGWSDVLTNSSSAIQWTTTSDLLAPGGSLSGFVFDSTETPAELLGTVPSGTGAGDPITTAFVYIAAPLADPGFQLVATPAAVTATPEPATFALFAAVGLCILGGRLVRERVRPF